MLSVLVLLLVVAAASFAYRAFWMLRARPSVSYTHLTLPTICSV